MKNRIVVAGMFGYLVTVVAFWIGIVAVNSDDPHGTVIVTQQIELEVKSILKNPEVKNELSFF